MNNCADGVYESITKKQILKLFFVGSLIGIVVFLICYGWQVLDVTDDSWLLTGQDISQHYIGWKFYRTSAWHFPLGQIDGMNYPDVSCIVFTDSIPLFAIFFKILSPVLPETFQYFGLWGLMTYLLIGGISSVVIRKSTENCWLCWIGSMFFCLSPYVFQRMYGHTALAGHWIILLAIAIWIYKPYFNTFRKKLFAWTGVLIIASLVHIYFIPMVMLFMFGFCLQDLFENRGWKEDIIFAIIAVAADLIILYIVGAFSKSGSMAGGGLGAYSANINSLINPTSYVTLMPSLPVRDGQGEGFGYLGLGILLLSACAIGIYIAYGYWQAKYVGRSESAARKAGNAAFRYSVIIVVFILLILAWSPEIVCGTQTIFRIPYPSIIRKALSIFRASGRFIWCVGYIIMTWCIMVFCRHIRGKMACVFLGCILAIQAVDLHWIIESKQKHYSESLPAVTMYSDAWEKLAAGKEHLIILPYDTVQEERGSAASYEIANFAVNHHMTINYFPEARSDERKLEQNEKVFEAELLTGTEAAKNLYILDTDKKAEELGLSIHMVDGYWVGVLP